MKTRSIALVSVLALLTGCGGGGGGSTAPRGVNDQEKSLASKAYSAVYVPIAEARLYTLSSIEMKSKDLPTIVGETKTTSCPNGGYYTVQNLGEKDGALVFKQSFTVCSMEYSIGDTLTFISGTREVTLKVISVDLLKTTFTSVYDDVAISLDGLFFEYSGTVKSDTSRSFDDKYPIKMMTSLSADSLLTSGATTFSLSATHLNSSPYFMIKPNLVLPYEMKVEPVGGIWLTTTGLKEIAVLPGISSGPPSAFPGESAILFTMDTGWVRFSTTDGRGTDINTSRINDHISWY